MKRQNKIHLHIFSSECLFHHLIQQRFISNLFETFSFVLNGQLDRQRSIWSSNVTCILRNIHLLYLISLIISFLSISSHFSPPPHLLKQIKIQMLTKHNQCCVFFVCSSVYIFLCMIDDTHLFHNFHFSFFSVFCLVYSSSFYEVSKIYYY
jgi:hypothetical protein